ncbi:MAG TPA: flavoprotein [Halieaceae bacterium]|jgi:3-oxo-5alpha-steroid 4-dehydrogenase|uniref:FAD-dependent oxidoreductase n=1 Tax=Haliea TaxID=475794 RepID=UPI000C3AFD73|nr:FAD-dependent oxidoreductase [Haliea sp.]HAN68568.1 flavoprotein [Halieaceae bacterium]MAD62271.1 flavoprotein [Haliea sp.]MAY93724.1 flavoprotein [Haliea sp.]MBK41483.1 flavoprotein [Haliea sp.]HBQ41665.1 flavoprotein [Halieaceae bacterium]|tara:strand:- start:23049 stop:24572 length:1524 start_codon:yes stop_codon:yes gene_type:complete
MSASRWRRRELLAGLAAGSAGFLAAGPAAALSPREAGSWDETTDVLVAGSGSAACSAAIEARRMGARVLLIEALPKFGGSSAMSGGVVYAGGGTALQKAAGFEDSVEEMYRFIAGNSGRHPQLAKIQLYCEESVAHFDWLVAMGVPYNDRFTAVKELTLGDESLYYSGNELAWPAREHSRPVPRGHVPGTPGMTGGRTLMEALLAQTVAADVTMRSGVAGQRLIVEADGRVAGMQVVAEGETRNIRALRGVVLACGGFIHNRDMVQRHAPALFDCSAPWGNAGDLGQGIMMGAGVGGETLHMHEGFAITPIYPPESTLAGIVVNANAQRFVPEDSYYGVLGDAIAYQQEGRAWLITDASSSFDYPQDNFLPVAEAPTIGDLAARTDFPQGALQHTVAYYNRFADIGRDPLFHKQGQYLRPLDKPPFKAWDLSVKRAFFTAHTFGGLHTDIDGRVIGGFGEPIPGLYAAGRTTAGLPVAPYIASGLSVGDCTFFGRRAGVAAASEVSV